MKILSTLPIALSLFLLPHYSYAFPELPFCPAGGPPGWMNHFNYKRDQNIWRRHSHYNSAANNPGRYPAYFAPVRLPAYYPYNYTNAPAPSMPRYQHR